MGYGRIELAFSEKDGLFSVTEPGVQSGLPVKQSEELKRVTQILERHLPEDWPPGREIRKDLDRLFRETQAEVILPFSREDQLLALVFLSAREKEKTLSVEERGYLQAVMDGGSIALSNSNMFQNIANLKDRLEIQARKLQREIVEREETQKALEQSGRRYRLLAENMKDIVCMLDLATLHVSCIGVLGWSRFWGLAPKTDENGLESDYYSGVLGRGRSDTAGGSRKRKGRRNRPPPFRDFRNRTV